MVDSVKINFIQQMGDKMWTGMAANTQLLIWQKLRGIVFAFNELLIWWRDRESYNIRSYQSFTYLKDIYCAPPL